LADGSIFPASGEYLAIEAPRRIVLTRRYDWDYPELGRRDTTVTYVLDPIPAGTRLTVRQDGFAGLRGPADHHADGWLGFLAYLGQYVRSTAE
ncbi:MAG TPA: SRPBCC family protein, partial [Gemmatimonadaceae bacterium]